MGRPSFAPDCCGEPGHMRLAPFLMLVGVVRLQQPEPIELVTFTPESRSLREGETARSTLAIRNPAAASITVWFGYSVRDSSGRWYDVPSTPVTIPARGTASRTLEWRV